MRCVSPGRRTRIPVLIGLCVLPPARCVCRLSRRTSAISTSSTRCVRGAARKKKNAGSWKVGLGVSLPFFCVCGYTNQIALLLSALRLFPLLLARLSTPQFSRFDAILLRCTDRKHPRYHPPPPPVFLSILRVSPPATSFCSWCI